MWGISGYKSRYARRGGGARARAGWNLVTPGNSTYTPRALGGT